MLPDTFTPLHFKQSPLAIQNVWPVDLKLFMFQINLLIKQENKREITWEWKNALLVEAPKLTNTNIYKQTFLFRYKTGVFLYSLYTLFNDNMKSLNCYKISVNIFWLVIVLESLWWDTGVHRTYCKQCTPPSHLI